MRAILLAVLFLISPRLFAADYQAELLSSAHTYALAQLPAWQALLHYHPRLVRPGFESFVDDPKFFLAVDGKTNPAAELDATLRAFFAGADAQSEHAQCRFIARYRWLQRELGFDAVRLPRQPCTRYANFRAQFGEQPRLTLVFASSYLNNPASLFGHSLLRIDADAARPQLLSVAVNYAADTRDPMSFAFAMKGVFGGYPGRFTGGPYHLKVTEYADLENRDLWEYRLALDAAERERLLEHLWELFPVYFDYYFFDENCAFHLLSLLEVARPTLRLTQQFRGWTIPADTVRAVTEAGLVTQVDYRPARATELRAAEHALTADEIALARSLVDGVVNVDDERLRALPPERQASVLELAVQLADYRRLAGQRRKRELAFTADARVDELLSARSRLDAPGLPPVSRSAAGVEAGHDSARVTFGLGNSRGRGFQELQLRAGYHDLLDPGIGYDRATQLSVFDVRLRHTDAQATQLERLGVVDLLSVQPRAALLDVFAWHVNAELRRRDVREGAPGLIPAASLGGGVAFAPVERMLVYGLAEVELDVSHRLQRDYALGAGPNVGVIIDASDAWRMQLSARSWRYALGDVHNRREITLAQSLRLPRQQSLRLEVGRTHEFNADYSFTALYWNKYF